MYDKRSEVREIKVSTVRLSDKKWIMKTNKIEMEDS